MALWSSLATQGAKILGGKVSQQLARYGGGRAARVGGALATVAAGTAIGNQIGGGLQDMGPVRKRRKGLSGRDIQGAQRVMALVSSFGYKPKLPCRRKARSCKKG